MRLTGKGELIAYRAPDPLHAAGAKLAMERLRSLLPADVAVLEVLFAGQGGYDGRTTTRPCNSQR
jgi:hypothetical protein